MSKAYPSKPGDWQQEGRRYKWCSEPRLYVAIMSPWEEVDPQKRQGCAAACGDEPPIWFWSLYAGNTLIADGPTGTFRVGHEAVKQAIVDQIATEQAQRERLAHAKQRREQDLADFFGPT